MKEIDSSFGNLRRGRSVAGVAELRVVLFLILFGIGTMPACTHLWFRKNAPLARGNAACQPH